MKPPQKERPIGFLHLGFSLSFSRGFYPLVLSFDRAKIAFALRESADFIGLNRRRAEEDPRFRFRCLAILHLIF
jgi:hypothetical protein